ncbi:metallophosphoesterase [Reichenbachiella sp. MSK19-1]|uniref:metallophosphoesterase n=1 Tax=Reichenbachiella sp. MSK19-1 TaxID=1897631 RepID=UPI000ED174A8|nr:metallophosphoesterase [Reichenbachiella sp. MSK19-1]RJE72768.1 hypothetical protein BGP76_02085 [Reichenbachiella sp. MSK19-1]
MKRLLILVVLIGTVQFSRAQDALSEWWFWPDYTLDRHANNPIGPRLESPKSPVAPLKYKTYPFEFFGQDPTERVEGFFPSERVPTEAFSVEFWLLYHVNQEVGIMTTYRYQHEEQDPLWLLGVYGRQVVFTLKDQESAFSSALNVEVEGRGWKNYWAHLVATYDGQSMKLYLNGELKAQMKVGKIMQYDPKVMQLENAAYLSHEPYMQMGDLLKCQRLYRQALSKKEIEKNFEDFQNLTIEGKLYPDLFHYNAGPYLQMGTPTQMGVVWETSEPANTVIEYGTSVPLTESVKLETLKSNRETGTVEGSNINQYVFKNLEPGQAYFYNIKSTSKDGQVIESGISTFKTGEVAPASFTFSVIGDTEARPHVNNRVSKLLWDERPEFLLNLGDLTDGGQEANKFQWNYEYFHAMSQLTSRIPVYPVAGNGEGDLYWFNQYHILPYKYKAYYKFTFGNAEFFMLDSNRKDQFAEGAEQYVWLEEQLQHSTAEWKFVAHHHAPYSSDEDDYGDSWKESTSMGDPEIKPIVPLYEKYGVDMVFFGHLHTYQRTHQILDNKVTNTKGVTYVQAGGAGGNLEDFAPTRSWFSAKTFRGHHYLTIEVFGDELELRMYDSEGRMKDIFKLNKSTNHE